MTAKEFLQEKYPSMRGNNWNRTNIDDDWVAEMMTEYKNLTTSDVVQQSELVCI